MQEKISHEEIKELGHDLKDDLKSIIREIPDFPKKGILFRDITPLLRHPKYFNHAIEMMLKALHGKKIDVVASAESRGFIFGSILAHRLGIAFVPIRKPGKLPHKTIRQDFATEYSTDAFEIHEDAIKKGEKVLIVDDLLATGGTAKAAADLVKRLGGNVVGCMFLIELAELKGREMLKGYDVYSIIRYD